MRVHDDAPSFDRDEAVQILLELWGAPTITFTRTEEPEPEQDLESAYVTADDTTPIATPPKENGHVPEVRP